MDTRYLKTLVIVVQAGSFSNAAKSLHITQSAVSQRIKFLEDSFGHSLFDRSGVALRLTAAGQIVLESARHILGIEDALRSKLKQMNGRKRISLCCTPTFGIVYLPGVLNRFMLTSGGTSSDLNFVIQDPDQALEGLAAKEFDLVVIEHCSKTDFSHLQSYPLPEDELVFVSSPKLGLPPDKTNIRQLLQYTIFVRDGGCSSRQLLTLGLNEHGLGLDDFASVITSEDLRLTCQTILSGAGISFMSRSLVCEYLQTGQMVEHQVEGFPHLRLRNLVMEAGSEKQQPLADLARCLFNVMDVSSPF